MTNPDDEPMPECPTCGPKPHGARFLYAQEAPRRNGETVVGPDGIHRPEPDPTRIVRVYECSNGHTFTVTVVVG